MTSSGKLTCEAIGRAALGTPLRHEVDELVWQCAYPERHAHGDTHPSLKVNRKKDTWGCFVCGEGGTAWQLAAFLARLDPSDKAGVSGWLRKHGLLPDKRPKASHVRREPAAIYEYRDAQGNPVARKLRFEPGQNGRKKDFAWQRWENGAWVDGLAGIDTPLYRLPEIVAEQFAVVTEGEKDCDAGASIRLPATTSGGTDSFREDHADALHGKNVCVVCDADPPGRAEGLKRAAMLYGKAVSIRMVEFANAKDLAEWIERGGRREQFVAIYEAAPEWRPQAGSKILDSVFRFIQRFVSVSKSQARAVALWVAHTHALDAADCTPYLSINSPEKQSGKTRLLEVLEILVREPWLTGRVTAAVLVRKVDAVRPTLLLDESDAAFGAEKEYAEALRGILNTGYRRSGVTSCCVGQAANISFKDFQTFSAKAIAGIGKLPDTVGDRSIPIQLRRAKRGSVERFRKRDIESESSDVAAGLNAWCKLNIENLRAARPEIPPELSDRQADCCEPLLAIADLAGGEWPEAARRALVELCAQGQAGDASIGVKLLLDIERIFCPRDEDGEPLPMLERIASCDLAKALGELEDRPWIEWGKSQKPITSPQMARLLARYGISPTTIRLPDRRRLKGYEREQFIESWEVYLGGDSLASPTKPEPYRDAVTTRENSGESSDFESVTPVVRHVSENTVLANKNGGCHGVTLAKADSERPCSHCNGTKKCACGLCRDREGCSVCHGTGRVGAGRVQ